MPLAAIGGMQLKRWTGYFSIILPTLRVLKAAKLAEGCPHADTFKAGDVYFAVSVWETNDQMDAFARAKLHAGLSRLARTHLAMFHNHSEDFDRVPNRTEMVTAWKAAMAAREWKGTIGAYRG